MYLLISKGTTIAELEERWTIDCQVASGAAFMFITLITAFVSLLQDVYIYTANP